jgi:hypothetical protein
MKNWLTWLSLTLIGIGGVIVIDISTLSGVGMIIGGIVLLVWVRRKEKTLKD